MQKRKVIQYSLDMEPIREFSSIREAEAMYHITHISSVCRQKRRADGGFIWRYGADTETAEK